MADGIIGIKISGASAAGSKRLIEPSPSFASDRVTLSRTAAAAPPGVSARAEIAVEKRLIDAQVALVAEIRELRKTMRSAAPGTSERTSLQGQLDTLLAQQKRNLTGAYNTGAVARDRALTTRGGVAIMPSGRILARSLYGVASETFAGNPMGALHHAVRGAGAIGAGRYLAGGGEAAEGAATDITGGAAAEAVAAAGGSIIGSILGVGGTAAALAAAGYEAYQHPAIVKGIASSPLALFLARRYSREEATRQTGAYRYAREFGEAGAPLASFTRSSRFSALGMDAQQALDVVGQMRETAGSRNVTSAQAYRAARLGTDIGLSNADIAQIGGAAGRLGIDPARAIDIIARGVEKGGQQGLQGEVARAQLDFIRSQSRIAGTGGAAGLANVAGMSALLTSSGEAAFRGVGAVAGVRGLVNANMPGPIFSATGAIGAADITIAQNNLYNAVSRDPRFAARDPRTGKPNINPSTGTPWTPFDRYGETQRILQQNLAGPYASMYLRSAIAPEIQTAIAQGQPGIQGLEGKYGWPSDVSTDIFIRKTLLPEAQAGNVAGFTVSRSRLKARGKKQIPAATKALAAHAMARSAAGASSMRTFVGVENVEAAMLRRLAIAPSTDQDVSRLLNKFASVIAPSAAATPTSERAAIPTGDAARLARADLSRLTRPPMLRAEMGGHPIGAPSSTTGGDPGARDSTLQAVGAEIVTAINVLITALANAGAYSLPPATLPAPAHDHERDHKHISLK